MIVLRKGSGSIRWAGLNLDTVFLAGQIRVRFFLSKFGPGSDFKAEVGSGSYVWPLVFKAENNY